MRIMGYTAKLNPEERYSLEDLIKFVSMFPAKKCVFIYNRKEIKLHAIRFSNKTSELEFLLKDVPLVS